jgi:phosphatidylglycerophosphate synthase
VGRGAAAARNGVAKQSPRADTGLVDTAASKPTQTRRPLKTRGRRAPRVLAGRLSRLGVRPNHVSLAGIAFAALAAGALVAVPGAGGPAQVVLLVAAALAVQLRLLSNLVDGLLAVEGGLKSKTGEVWNDVPDRIADVLILAGAGYAAGSLDLGLAAGAAALLTAYVRVLAGSLGATQRFSGPMAKQHRMAVVTAACLVSPAEVAISFEGRVLLVGVAVVLVGSLLTFALRLRALALELESR